jgi:nitrate reductase NapAB chaperone NapD
VVAVSLKNERLDGLTRDIDALPWAEVHHSDPEGRLVVTIEATDTHEHTARLRQVQALPHVLMAEMAEYYVGDE